MIFYLVFFYIIESIQNDANNNDDYGMIYKSVILLIIFSSFSLLLIQLCVD